MHEMAIKSKAIIQAFYGQRRQTEQDQVVGGSLRFLLPGRLRHDPRHLAVKRAKR